jgi:hypothetical protein
LNGKWYQYQWVEKNAEKAGTLRQKERKSHDPAVADRKISKKNFYSTSLVYTLREKIVKAISETYSKIEYNTQFKGL